MNKTITHTLDKWPYHYEEVPFHITRRNTKRYLTILVLSRIVERVNKANRKDDKMAVGKNGKSKLTKWASVAILAVAGVNGITEFLGGKTADAVVAGLLCFVLTLLILQED